MLTLQQCADRLGISYCTVRKHAIQGHLRASKVGGWRVEPHDLEAFINSRRPQIEPARIPEADSDMPPVANPRFA